MVTQHTYSKLAKHAWDHEHRFQWDQTKILHTESHYYKRKLIEAPRIKLTENPISQSSIDIRPLWIPHLKRHFDQKTNPYKPGNNNTNKNLPVLNPPIPKTHTMTLRNRRL